jgi:glycerate kinase
LRPGAELVLEVLEFSRRVSGASLVVTGEGRLDRQTIAGKAPHAVAQAAKEQGVPTVALAGSVECLPQELEEYGFSLALSIVPGPMRLEEAVQRGAELVERAAETLGRALTLALFTH